MGLGEQSYQNEMNRNMLKGIGADHPRDIDPYDAVRPVLCGHSAIKSEIRN